MRIARTWKNLWLMPLVLLRVCLIAPLLLVASIGLGAARLMEIINRLIPGLEVERSSRDYY